MNMDEDFKAWAWAKHQFKLGNKQPMQEYVDTHPDLKREQFEFLLEVALGNIPIKKPDGRKNRQAGAIRKGKEKVRSGAERDQLLAHYVLAMERGYTRKEFFAALDGFYELRQLGYSDDQIIADVDDTLSAKLTGGSVKSNETDSARKIIDREHPNEL